MHEPQNEKNRKQHCTAFRTHPVAKALQIVVVGGALGLVDVRIDADARLVHAHQIVTAGRAIAHQTVAGEIGRCLRAAC